jgi:hypothetical protein
MSMSVYLSALLDDCISLTTTVKRSRRIVTRRLFTFHSILESIWESLCTVQASYKCFSETNHDDLGLYT